MKKLLLALLLCASPAAAQFATTTTTAPVGDSTNRIASTGFVTGGVNGTVQWNVGANSNVLLAPWGGNPAYNALSLNGLVSATNLMGWYGGASGDPSIHYNVPSPGGYEWRVGNTILMSLSSGGIVEGGPGFGNGSLQLNGATSGSTTVSVSPTGSLILPTIVTVPDTPGAAVDRTGASDVGGLINSAITAAKNCGSSTGTAVVYLRAGTYLITTPIVPKSCVQIRGDGPGRTILLTNSNAPFGPPAGQQLVHCGLDGVTFKDSGTHAGATVMTFPNIQDCKLTNIDFVGYSTGTLMSIATAAVTTFDDTNTIWNNSNAIFNYFLNWWTDGCTGCIKEAGAYGATPTASPPNSSNVPSQLVTQNRYDNIILYCAGKCIDFIKATDSEYLTNVLFKATSGAVVGVQIGDDPAFPGNNYTNAIYLQGSISLSGATSFTLTQAGNWTYANKFDIISSDVPLGSLTTAVAQASVTQFKAEICLANVVTDAAGFNTGKLCASNNYSGTGDGQSTYSRVPNGLATNPVFGFANDSGNGFYLPAAGTFGLTKQLSVGVNGGTGGQVTLNGATSGNAVLSATATGGILNLNTAQIGPTGGVNTGVGGFQSNGAFATLPPATLTGTSGSVNANATTTIINSSGAFTATLPSAVNFAGQWLYIVTVTANAVTSASSNVTPRTSTTAGTALLPATAGAWTALQSDGTNWRAIMGTP